VSLTPRFLSVDDVLMLHAIAIEDQGGDSTLRDRSSLESAVAMPEQQFGGRYLHEDIPAMAAAYAFHICMNHPFLDGNKRAATASMIAFLSDNGWKFDATADEAEPAILQLAAGSLDKPKFTDWARTHMHEKPKTELRDFFRTLDAARLQSFLRGWDQASGSEEFVASIAEARVFCPLVSMLEQQILDASRTGNKEVVVSSGVQLMLLVSLYRIAEDMGYEW
jgi:death-on-curing protein